MKRMPFSAGLPASAALGFAASASDNLRPHLETRHGVHRLIVDSKPFLVLGGELHNSSSSSREYMKRMWPRLVEKNLNTVLEAVSWELIGLAEGKFDFSPVAGVSAGLKIR